MKKGQGNTSSVSASAIPTRSTMNNDVSAAIANNDALFDRKIDLITEGIDLLLQPGTLPESDDYVDSSPNQK